MKITDLDSKLELWLSNELITEQQLKEISEFEKQISISEEIPKPDKQEPEVKSNRTAETMAYIGGIIIFAGLGRIVFDYWEDMDKIHQCLLLCAISGLLMFFGKKSLYRPTQAMYRLCAFLTFLSLPSIYATAVFIWDWQIDDARDWGLVLIGSALTAWILKQAKEMGEAVDTNLNKLQGPLHFAAGLLVYSTGIILLSGCFEIEMDLGILIVSLIGAAFCGNLWLKRINHTLQISTATLSALSILMLNSVIFDSSSGDIREIVLFTMLWIMGLAWLMGSLSDRIKPHHTGLKIAAIILAASPIALIEVGEIASSLMACLSGAVLIHATTKSFNKTAFAAGSLSILFGMPTFIYELLGDSIPGSLMMVILGSILLGAGHYLNRLRLNLDDSTPEQ